ncbi:hypothetical protein OkiPb01551_20520 [Bordetella pertussis]|nr:hypothetical protein L518_0017 [Bordetella bronchiseptica MBORD675]BCY19958.1 hypothetical protein BPJ_03500 [Bordetella pertussis]BDT06646.1 hypothetical protein BP3J_03500 [Bordetella pertussis]
MLHNESLPVRGFAAGFQALKRESARLYAFETVWRGVAQQSQSTFVNFAMFDTYAHWGRCNKSPGLSCVWLGFHTLLDDAYANVRTVSFWDARCARDELANARFAAPDPGLVRNLLADCRASIALCHNE